MPDRRRLRHAGDTALARGLGSHLVRGERTAVDLDLSALLHDDEAALAQELDVGQQRPVELLQTLRFLAPVRVLERGHVGRRHAPAHSVSPDRNSGPDSRTCSRGTTKTPR